MAHSMTGVAICITGAIWWYIHTCCTFQAKMILGQLIVVVISAMLINALVIILACSSSSIAFTLFAYLLTVCVFGSSTALITEIYVSELGMALVSKVFCACGITYITCAVLGHNTSSNLELETKIMSCGYVIVISAGIMLIMGALFGLGNIDLAGAIISAVSIPVVAINVFVTSSQVRKIAEDGLAGNNYTLTSHKKIQLGIMCSMNLFLCFINLLLDMLRIAEYLSKKKK